MQKLVVRSLVDGCLLPCAFDLDGGDLPAIQAGDAVRCWLSLSREQAAAVTTLGRADLAPTQIVGHGPDEWRVAIEVAVCERRHTLLPSPTPPAARHIGCELIGTPVNSHHEDILRWTLLGQAPPWLAPTAAAAGENAALALAAEAGELLFASPAPRHIALGACIHMLLRLHGQHADLLPVLHALQAREAPKKGDPLWMTSA